MRKEEGYDIQFLYGGDADFTNMRSYFISSGFQSIVSDKDFPVSDLLSKWGANDGTTFIRFSESDTKSTEASFYESILDTEQS